MDPFILVSCVSQKLDRRAPAAELYVSDWFRKARAYAERWPGGWAILSALHGVVAPDAGLDPYNCTIRNLDRQQRAAWSDRVCDQLNALAFGRPLVILAGADYRAALGEWYRFRHCFPHVTVPMQGLGIGEQKAWLVRALRQARAQNIVDNLNRRTAAG